MVHVRDHRAAGHERGEHESADGPADHGGDAVRDVHRPEHATRTLGCAIRCIPDGVPGSFRTLHAPIDDAVCPAGGRGYPAPVTRAFIPDEILALAHERARAREARDWAEADRLRAAIETAGWRIVDRGTDFALTPAAPPDGRRRAGAIRREPQRAVAAGRRAEGLATVILIATDWPEDLERALAGLRSSPPGTSVVIVADAPSVAQAQALEALDGGRRQRPDPRDRLDERAARPRGGRSTPGSGGRAGRSSSILDTSVEPQGDIVTPLADALGDPTVGGRRARGASSRATCASSRTPRPVTSTRSAAMRWPSDGRTTWSGTARRAVPLLPQPRHLVEPRPARRGGGRDARAARCASPVCRSIRHEHRGWTSLPDEERDRLSKRNFYRIIDRFGSRRDLLTARGPG